MKKLTIGAKQNRKELVKALVTLTEQPPAYQGPPTYAYMVGDYMVDREGDVLIPENLSGPTEQNLIQSLEDMGFVCIAVQQESDISSTEDDTENTEEKPEETEAQEQEEANEEPKEPETEDASEESENTETEPAKVTLSFPVELFAKDAIERMKAIVASKASLLKKALGTDSLDIAIEGEKVSFPWFTDHGLEGEVDAYSKLAFAIAKMAITQTRVIATEKQNPDEKLAMRLFLIRLGFIGDEYKSARAILMRNFSTNESRKKADATINLCMPEVSKN